MGCFDILHPGHIFHLHAAARMGSVVVGVTMDKSVNKGPGRPVMEEIERMLVVCNLRVVEEVALVKSSLDALKVFKPDIFCLGADYRHRVRKEDRAFCKKHGIKIKFTNEFRMSSTEIYERIRSGQ